MKRRSMGILADNDPCLVIAILGVLKSGNFFVPLSPIYPVSRIHFIINDCQINVLISDRANYEKARMIAEQNSTVEQLVCIDHRGTDTAMRVSLKKDSGSRRVDETPEEMADSTFPCYVIYTSGSTGKPKGVVINNENLVLLLSWFRDYFRLGTHTRVIQSLSYSFDFGIFEILTTILFGGVLHPFSREELGDPNRYMDCIDRYKINTVHTTPTFFTRIIALKRKLPGLETIHFGGEALRGRLVRDAARLVSPQCKIYNGYGPTEAAINTSIYSMKAEEVDAFEDRDRIPIGKPSSCHAVYIVGRHFRLKPIGIPGELCIGGRCISAGYLNNLELTTERFIRPPIECLGNGDSHIPNSLWYRTGDWVRWLEDGNIEFLERVDQQVKIRGFRIELGEIEDRLKAHEWVKAAAVRAWDDEERGRYMAAYIVWSQPEWSVSPVLRVSSLREYLSQRLPDYMIPAYFVELTEIPVTASGKVDQRGLPKPCGAGFLRSSRFVKARTETERKLVSIWKEVLGIDSVGVYDDFFELGGDSILASRAIALMRKELRKGLTLKSIFIQPKIEGLARDIDSHQSKGETVNIGKAPDDVLIPLSFPQEQLWLLANLYQDNVSYHVPRALRLKGKVRVRLFEVVVTEIVRRHEILRTVFPGVDGQPCQVVQEPFAFKIPVLDLSDLADMDKENRVTTIVREEGQRNFDLERGPLLRLKFLKLAEDEWVLVSTEHHLVHDGWTQGVLIREFVQLYHAFLRNRPSPLPELPIQYKDYAYWQRHYMSGPRLKRHLDFWKGKLVGLPPLLELPTDYPRPEVISGKGVMERLVLSEILSAALNEFSRKNSVTLFMTMLAVFKVLLYRYTGTGNFCVGTGVANRRFKEMEGMLGMVINTIAVRSHISGEMKFRDYLQIIKTACMEAYEYEDTPFEKVVEAVCPKRSLSFNPLYQVSFSFFDIPVVDLTLPELEVNLIDSHNRSSKFDLNIIVIPSPDAQSNGAGETLIDWEYSTELFSSRTMKRMSTHYFRLLQDVVENPGKKIADLSLLSQSEIQQLLFELNGEKEKFEKDKTVHEVFEARVTGSADYTAVAGGDGLCFITYKELNRKANQLARELRKRSVVSNTIVGLMVERSIEMILGILGILKAGGAYLPIDPVTPPNRMEYILEDSGAKLLLSQERLKSHIYRYTETLDLENASFLRGSSDDLRNTTSAENLAYVMYTSGTTGRPKGVMIIHKNVNNLVAGLCNRVYKFFKKESRVALIAPYVFDASVKQVFSALLLGHTLYLAPDDSRLDGENLLEFYRKYDIDISDGTPAHLRLLAEIMEAGAPSPGVGHFIIGGDVLNKRTLRKFFNGYRNDAPKITNVYGPTECCVDSTSYVLSRENIDNHESIPIGIPMPNQQLFVLDKSRKLLPFGVPGELWIGGDGVGQGYLNNGDLTWDKFAPNPSASIQCGEDIFYRTGDLARWHPDGHLEFLGRLDTQIKIRGHRIELGEIENQLLKHPDVNEVVVNANRQDEEDTYLCAHIVSAGDISAAALKEFLARQLAAYMIPSFFVFVERIPLTVNGKIDRKAFPEPNIGDKDGLVAPRNRIEKILSGLWSEVLGIRGEAIGIDDDFFESGGQSLKANFLVWKIRKALDVKIPVGELFSTPSIRGLSEFIVKAKRSIHEDILPVEKREYYSASSAQKRLLILNEMGDLGITYNMPAAWIVEGTIDKEHLKDVAEALIKRHESLRTCFGWIAKEPVQFIKRETVINVRQRNLAGEGSAGELHIESEMQAFVRLFDLTTASLFRVGLIDFPGGRHLLLFDMHHIISDGVSMGILARDFIGLFEKRGLKDLKLHYKDFSEWQNRSLDSEEMKAKGDYWVSKFLGEIPTLDMITDFPRGSLQSFKGDLVKLTVNEELKKWLDKYAQETQTTSYIILLAVFNVLLARYAEKEDIIVGTPLAGRNHADLGDIIGIFVNTLPLRNFPCGDKTFGHFLEEVKENALAAYENQDYPFEELVSRLNIAKDPSRNPIFNVLFVSENTGIPRLELEGMKISPFAFNKRVSHLDLVFYVIESEGELDMLLEYSTDLFERSTVEEMGKHYIEILKQVENNGEIEIKDIKISHGFQAIKSEISQLEMGDFTF